MFCQVNLSRQWQFRLILVVGVGLFYTLSGAAALGKITTKMEKASLLSLAYSNCSSMPYLRMRYQCQLTLIYRYIPGQRSSASVSDDYRNLYSLHLPPYSVHLEFNELLISVCTPGYLCSALFPIVPCGDSLLAKAFHLKSTTVLYLMKLGTSHHMLEPSVFGKKKPKNPKNPNI